MANFYQTNTLGTVFFYIGLGFFATFAFAFLVSAIVSHTNKQRKFSVTALTIVSIAATAYLAMGMGFGSILRTVDGRQIYYARYIDWVFTTPLLLYDLGTFAGVGLPQILVAIVFDVLMIIVGLFGALTHQTAPRWVWFGMGCLAFIPILYLVLFNWRKYRVPEVKRPYTIQSIYLAVIWLVYPIAWGLGTGANVISVDAETVWVTILDIIAKCFYGSLWVFFFREYLPYSEGEVADRIAQAPRHPSTVAPPPGVAQPIDNSHPYHQQRDTPMAPMGNPAVTAIAGPSVGGKRTPNLVRRSGTLERGPDM